MIVAVSLNPALDVTHRLEAPLVIGGTNRICDVASRPGGRALNVARVLRHLGRTVRVVAPVGGQTGDSFRRERSITASTVGSIHDHTILVDARENYLRLIAVYLAAQGGRTIAR